MIEETERVAFKAPPLSFDTHFHVFGPADKYPVQFSDRYVAPLAPLSDYLKLARHLGIERLVFVQPSAYGTDNACMLDAMDVLQHTHAVAGLVDVPADCPDSTLEDMHRRGVRGVRVNTSPYMKPDPKRAEVLKPQIEMLASRLAGLGWCIEFLSPGWLTEALLPTMQKLRLPFILDHMGLFLGRDGPETAGFKQMLRMIEGGHCWIKLTGAYRMSQPPRYADAAPMARELVEAAPDRLLWGSDYPHLGFKEISSVGLFNLLADWLPTESLRRKVLAENPAKLFGFGASAGRINYGTVFDAVA